MLIIDGDDWQEHCLRLLELRYGAALQRVPDARLGDLGIEAFTRSDGQVYQCYRAEEPVEPDTLHERQRNKLTRDLSKLTRNVVEIYAMVDGPICRYVFLVHRVADRRIVQHASEKTRDLRARCLPECSEDIEVTVQTDSAFMPEREELARSGVTIPISPAAPDAVKVAAVPDDKIAALERKLTVAGFAGDANDRMRKEFLNCVVRMQDFVGQLHDDYPSLWGDLMQIRSQRERRLTIETGLSADTPRVQLTRVIDTLADELAAVPGLGRENALDVSYGTAGQWLLDCPLDFDGTEQM
jgi:hypothetical protein